MMKFLVLAPCRLVCRCHRFRGTYWVRHYFSPEDGDSMFHRNVDIYGRVNSAPKPQNFVTLIAVKTWSQKFELCLESFIFLLTV
jgi:hypothetical protein